MYFFLLFLYAQNFFSCALVKLLFAICRRMCVYVSRTERSDNVGQYHTGENSSERTRDDGTLMMMLMMMISEKGRKKRFRLRKYSWRCVDVERKHRNLLSFVLRHWKSRAVCFTTLFKIWCQSLATSNGKLIMRIFAALLLHLSHSKQLPTKKCETGSANHLATPSRSIKSEARKTKKHHHRIKIP